MFEDILVGYEEDQWTNGSNVFGPNKEARCHQIACSDFTRVWADDCELLYCWL